MLSASRLIVSATVYVYAVALRSTEKRYTIRQTSTARHVLIDIP
jgi:hypothetical protein